MSRLRKYVTFSNTVALFALFFALGGTVYAANKISGSQITPKSIPANRLKPASITASQIKKGAIGASQIKGGAIGAKQIQSGSITGSQIKSGSLTGTQVNQVTLTGVSAASIHTVQYVTSTVALAKEPIAANPGIASCPAGMKVIGGGATVNNTSYAYVNESAPTADRNGWYASGYAGTTGIVMTITAICTPVTAPAG